jgi:hypothetical protein
MGPALVPAVVHRRGVDRELARALGAIHPPPNARRAVKGTRPAGVVGVSRRLATLPDHPPLLE